MDTSSRARSEAATASGQTPDWGLTGTVFSISDYSAGISWLPLEPVSAAAAVAAAEVAAPDARSGAPAAAVAAGPAEAAAVAQAARSAAPDAAEAEVAAGPGVWVQRVRPAEGVLVAQPRASTAAPRPFWCALFPEPRVLLQESEPYRRP
jgi:hypothetical protein